MASMTPGSDTPPPPPCPTCGRPAENSYYNEEGVVIKAGFVCDQAHVWTTHWIGGAA